VAAFDRMQCEIIRAHSPGRWITHNFMGFFNEFDHWRLSDQLDFASWDSYPLGFVERFPFSEEERNRWALTSHPDIAPFHHDLYRGVGRGRFWVMEQQPGPVNWAPWNPVPKPGMVRLWTWEAFAHGADVVSYFRWRQAVSAQEQMHAGLNLPGSHELSPGGIEASQVARELRTLGALPAAQRAAVALVYDYESAWVARIQPHGADFRYHELAFRCYEAVRRLGLDVDFLPPGASLAGYALVLVPSLPIVSDAAERAFAATDGIVLYGPRTGSKTRHFGIPAGLPPGPLASLLSVRVREVSSLRPGLSVPVTGRVGGAAIRWREHLDRSPEAVAQFADGAPALVANGRHHYVACWPDRRLLCEIAALLAGKAGLTTIDLPEGVRLRRRGGLTFAFNYSDESWPAPAGGRTLLGARPVGPQDVAVWTAESRAEPGSTRCGE
jgi:beta-galactosidase